MKYKALNQQIFKDPPYSIVPIRMADRNAIRQWRNEQMYHLRQNKPLTEEQQEHYFRKVVVPLFDQEQPEQILFSYLKERICIGYGGLVHINWHDKNAEISFVMNTELQEELFEYHWVKFLELLSKTAFSELYLHKIYTYAYNVRPRLYGALEKAGFMKETVLKEHALVEGAYKDIVIHAKFNILHGIHFRKATIQDATLLFEWANEKGVRKNAINQNPIEWESHLQWLKRKINDDSTAIFIAQSDETPVGQVRLDLNDNWWDIDFSIDNSFRGNGLGKELIKKVIDNKHYVRLRAIVKPENKPSLNVFESLGFNKVGKINKSGIKLIEYHYERTL